MLFTELKRLLLDEDGLTTVEYAIAGALVTVTLVGAFVALGEGVGSRVDTMCQVVKNDGTPCS
ncbi:hypothetical protein [Zobellella aerophila]|uniref:Flp family type IVb pilin n=1 Tax=Zobellella aerophila TaxID=870480 RepID=A0ABP6VCJ1_9GAMM